ncbi:MAG: hypothetical protein HY291_21890 [Planctomycetes bacterium]|nr:hypothetical protein [Planctomycetota bacterium]
MACFVLSALALKKQRLGLPHVDVPKLEVVDSRDDHGSEEADGTWIGEYVLFMEGIVRKRCGLPTFAFSDDYHLDADLFDEIPSPHVRALLIEFTNQVYPDWKDDGVDLPDYDYVRDDCRSYCEECEDAYEETYGTYDGPLAEDVEPDEDANAPGLSKRVRQARERRNAARQAERHRRQEARDDAESEVVDREWICGSDCDGFLDYVSERFRAEVTVDTDMLERMWEAFLEEKGERDFPPLIVELARRGS